MKATVKDVSVKGDGSNSGRRQQLTAQLAVSRGDGLRGGEGKVHTVLSARKLPGLMPSGANREGQEMRASLLEANVLLHSISLFLLTRDTFTNFAHDFTFFHERRAVVFHRHNAK